MVTVKDHYLRVHSDKASFVSALSGWVLERAADKSLMPGAISRFGLMPPLAISEQNLATIAEFVFEEPMEKPDWYARHYQEHHGADGELRVRETINYPFQSLLHPALLRCSSVK